MIPHSRPTITETDLAAVAAQLRSAWLAEGAAAATLETRFRILWNACGAVATGSGSQALLLALRAVGVGPGREVIVPTFVCAEVLGVVEALGATPVIVDVGADYLLDPDRFRDALSSRSAAVILPFVAGRSTDPARYREAGVPVVLDLAQYFPSDIDPDIDPNRRRPLLPAGDIAVFSFEATKVIAAGEGGLVLTRHPDLAQAIAAAKRLNNTSYKLNLYPLSDLQAALALSQLAQVPGFLARRSALAARYREQLTDAPGMISVPPTELGSEYRFLIRLTGMRTTDAVIAACAEAGVAVRRPVADLLHHLRPERAHPCPMAEKLYRSTLSLPLYPSLTIDEQRHVVSTLRTVLDG